MAKEAMNKRFEALRNDIQQKKDKEVVEEPKVEPIVEEKVEIAQDVEEVAVNDKFDLSGIIKKKDNKGKNKTFYLDEVVCKEVAKTAKKQGVSESSLVNDILKHVLNIR